MSKISFLGDSQLTVPLAAFLSQKAQYAKIRLLGNISPQHLDIAQDSVSTSSSYTDLDQCRSGSSLDNSDIVIICSSLNRSSLSFSLNSFISRIDSKAKILVISRSACRLSADIASQIGGCSHRVVGIPVTGSAYLRRQIANQIGVSIEDVTTFSIGNDEEVQIIPQYCRVNGIPIRHFLLDDQINKIISRKQIPISVDLLKVPVAQVVDAIVGDKKRLLTVASSVHSSHIFLKLPTLIGQSGAESTLPMELEPQQLEQFSRLVTKSVVSQT